MDSQREKPLIHNPEIAELVRESYGPEDLSRLEAALRGHGTLDFVALPNGLFSASSAGESIADTGYGNVWVRDCVQVAHALRVSGKTSAAAGAASALLQFFDLHRHRFENIISGAVDPEDAMQRPHIRFDGKTLSELPERWPHAQNDALGYFLWLYANLALHEHVDLGEREASLLALFPRYFEAIRFWQDEDSGHWEEVRKVSASSIGTVVAGLEALFRLIEKKPEAFRGRSLGADLLTTTGDLAARGREALQAILPQECAQVAPEKNRRYDAALVFLLHPLEIIEEPIATLVLHDVKQYLTGRFGVRRYLRDSYYAPDFDRDYSAERRTTDHSAGTSERDVLLRDVGEEAQWCIFDPMISAYHGAHFCRTRSEEDYANQILHFNRTLAQITEAWQCPELYYLLTPDDKVGPREYHPNRHVPLQWTQANLVVALEILRASVERKA